MTKIEPVALFPYEKRVTYDRVMARKQLSGPFDLDLLFISFAVSEETIGVYALGVVDKDGKFNTLRIGRSDLQPVGDRIAQYKTAKELEAIGKVCDKFQFAYVTSIEEAHENECYLWHERSPLFNSNHPDLPDGKPYLLCPVKGCERARPKTAPSGSGRK